jgi:hypothetical protein
MPGLIPWGIWAASKASAVAGDYELISTTVLGSSTPSVTFSNLGTVAAAYKHLQVRMTVRNDAANATNYGSFRINGDTGSNYANHRLHGNGSTVTSGADSASSTMFIGDFPAATNTASVFGAMIIDYLDFSSTTKNKTVRYFIGQPGSSSSVRLQSGLWASTAAITSISFAVQDGSNWVSGSRFSLYGLRG